MKTGTLWKLEESQFQSETHRWEKLAHPYTQEGKNTPVEFLVTRHELAQIYSPSQMEALFLLAGLRLSATQTAVSQLLLRSSVVSCSLWPCVGGTCACLEKILAIELYPETNNSMCFCYYGCVSIVFSHLPSASKFSLFAVCPSIHFRVCPFFTLLCPLCSGFQRLLNSGPTTPLPLLSLHALFILSLFVSLDCELHGLCRGLPAQWWHCSAQPILVPVRTLWS